MRKVSIKLLIRRFVLATSFPPFLQIYQAIYALVIFIAVCIFRRYPAVKAVYLRRSGSKGEMLPLVSDLDFTVVAEGMDEEDKKSLHCSYERLNSITTILDQFLEFYDKETFYKRYLSMHKGYRLAEAKATWKLLYGKDYLAELPELSLDKIYGGLYSEIRLWWTLFCWRLLQARKNHNEAVIRNSVCYKSVSEILKMNLALSSGILTFSRSEALAYAKLHLRDEENVIIEKLETIARKRFLVNDERILDETLNFLLNYIDRFHREFRAHPYAYSSMPVTQKVDCSKDEWLCSEKEQAHIRGLIQHVKEKWLGTYRGAYLVSGYYLLDELVLMIEVDPGRLPTISDLTKLYFLHCDTQFQLMSPIHLYLLMPHTAFQINAEYGKRSWQSILCPSSNPDLFELLCRPDFAVDGGSYRTVISPVWTPLVKEFLEERKNDLYERLHTPEVYALNSLDFLRIFWKIVQIVIINRSAQKDDILYPLTLPAVERAMAAEGISLPPRLQFLADAYRDELHGKSCNIAILIPEATAYLKEINI
jgi:hypothetical protein